MRAIYKYKLSVQDTVDLCIPEGAKILTLQMQQGCPCIWAEVNPQAPTEERTFAIRGTGHEFLAEHTGEYIGTVQDGALVLHAYETTMKEVPERLVKNICLREAEETLRKVTGYEASCVYDDDMGMIDVKLYGVPGSLAAEQEIEDKVYALETGKYDGYGAVFLVDVFKGKKPTTGDKAE